MNFLILSKIILLQIELGKYIIIKEYKEKKYLLSPFLVQCVAVSAATQMIQLTPAAARIHRN